MILDICIIILVIIAVFIGYKKGFIKLVAKLVGFFVAIIIAYFLYSKLGNYIYDNLGIGNNIKQAVTETVEKYVDNDEKLTDNKENNNLKNDILEKYIKQIVNEQKIESEVKNKRDTIIDQASEKIARFITKGLAFISIFIVVMICIFILSLILDSVFSLPILKAFNKTGGVIVSIILLLLRLYILFAVINFVYPLGVSFIDKVINYIDTTTITKFLYNKNLLVILISRFIL